MKIKKLLALLMALMMVVCVFAACGDDKAADNKDDEKVEEKADEKEPAEEPAEEEELTDEEVVEKTVVEFTELLLKGDEKALDYVAEESKADMEAAIDELQSEFEALTGGFDSEGVPEDFVTFMDGWAKDYMKAYEESLEVTVSNISIDGEEATADVVAAYIDVTVMNDIEAKLTAELTSRYTQDELMAMNEEESTAAAMEVIKVVYTDLIDEMKEAPKAEEEMQSKLKKVDGKWLVIE